MTRGPNSFKWGENILFMRPQRVRSCGVTGTTIQLLCDTQGFLNRTVQTHESSMHQFTSVPHRQGYLHVQIELWSPAIVRVRFALDELPRGEPAFPFKKARMLIGEPDAGFSISVTEDEWQIVATTDDLAVHIAKDPFTVKVFDRDGGLLWAQRRPCILCSDLWDMSVAHLETHVRADLFTADIFDTSVAQDGARTAYFESAVLGPHEELYGLGERFDHVARKGKAVDFWNKDAVGTCNTRTYINVPFLLSTRGYGLFLNSSGRIKWEVGTLEAATLGFAVEDASMDYFVVYGPAPSAILQRYASLTGFAPVPPIWSFGLWMSRNSYESWDVLHDLAKRLRESQVPTDVLHLDTSWFQQEWNCDLRFATDRFGEPEQHLKALKDQGFRVSLWQYNYVPSRDDNVNFREGLEKGFFARNPDGTLFSYPPGTNGSFLDDAIIDFSNPDACAWYAEQIKAVVRLGASAIKTDFGEGIPEDAVFKNIDGRRFHNLYALVYNSVVAEAVHEVSGEYIVWARSGTAGSQRYPVHWGGDAYCTWSELAGTLRGALSMGLSGFPFFSHDIGGFIGRPSPELYVRWAQFGLLSSHSRCHGSNNDGGREPWTFGEEASAIFTSYAQLRYRLLPYMYSQARQSTLTGQPLVRALVIEYPHDRNVWHIEDQYLFGDAMLIAPILAPLEESTRRQVYLPAGTWIDYWTKVVHASQGGWIEREVDMATMPMYIRAGRVIPYGEERLSTHNRIGPIVHLEVYMEGGEQRDLTYQYDDGTTRFEATLRSRSLSVSGLLPPPTVSIYGGVMVDSITGATWRQHVASDRTLRAEQ